MVSVPDGRLERITHYIIPQKVIPAMLKLVDIAGIVKGASEGEGLGNKFLPCKIHSNSNSEIHSGCEKNEA